MIFYKFLNVFWSFGPKGWVSKCLLRVWSLGVQYGNPRFCSSAQMAKSALERPLCDLTFPLERLEVRSSMNYELLEVSCFCRLLERQELRSSEDLSLTLERPSSVKITQAVLFQVYRLLERKKLRSSGPTHVCMSARAREVAFKWDSCFQQVLLSVSKCILAFSLHPRHS